MSNLPIHEMLAQCFASEDVRGRNVSDLAELPGLLRDHEPQGTAEISTIPIFDQVTSPTLRRVKIKGHGVV